MAPSIPTSPPVQFRAGDTVKFTVAPADFPVGDGWTVTYTVNGKGKVIVPAVESAGVYLITVAAAATAQLPAGTCTWVLRAERSGEKFTLAGGTLAILPNVENAVAGSLVSKAETTLAYIEAELQARAQSDHTEYSVDGFALKREAITDLWEWRDKLRAEINRARRGGKMSTLSVHFVRTGT